MASLSKNLVLRIGTPSPLLTTEKKIEDVVGQVNVQFDLLTDVLRNLFGGSGVAIPFEADIDMQGSRILHLADPIDEQDGVNRRYVAQVVDDLREELEEIRDIIHDELPAGGQPIVLTRDIPTTVDDIIEIGAFTLTGDAHTFDVSITVSATTFSVAKAYTIVANRGINSDWQICLPLFNTGAHSSQNFALEVKQVDADSQLLLRLRRTLGTTAGTATIQIEPRGVTEDLFQESSATASVTPPVLFLNTAILSVTAGNVGINATTLNHAGVGTALTLRGDDGDNPGVVEIENPAAAVNSEVGRVSFYRDTAELVRMEAQTGAGTDVGRWYLYTKPAGGALAFALVMTGNQNLVFGGGVGAGSSGEKVFVIATGVEPGSSPADSVQLYSKDIAAGNAVLHLRTENGTIIKLYQEAALTAEDVSVVDATYGAQEQAVIENLRTRVGELEARLQALGLIA